MSSPTVSSVPTATQRLGVGILGAGPVTQAIHLPTLSRMSDEFEVVAIMDVDASIAQAVANRVDARPTTDVADLIHDERVDVVAICSPSSFHAEHVIAACRAGVKAVLCEKPFAVSDDEATAIAQVSLETGVPIVVGAMHTFDPGWLAATEHWGDLVETAHTIRSSIVLPPNPRFEDFATEVVARSSSPAPDLSDPEVVKSTIQGSILGLAIHDLPLVRHFLPTFDDLAITRAQLISPFGYAISGTAGDRTIDLRSAITESWKPDWTLEVFARDCALKITFTPSYVQAGSAVAELRTRDGLRTFGPYSSNGYQGEWNFIYRLARREVPPIPTERLIDDLRFALAVADAAADAAVASEESAA